MNQAEQSDAINNLQDGKLDGFVDIVSIERQKFLTRFRLIEKISKNQENVIAA